MFDHPTTAREYLAMTIAEKFEMDFDTGDRGEIREFTAIALTDGVPLSRQQQINYSSNRLGSSADAARISRYLVKAMIIGNANDEMLPPTENPHRYLLDPCSLETTPNVATAVKIILMYTTYITSKDFNIAGRSLIKRGDKLRVTMTVDSRDANIQTGSGEVVEIVSKARNDPFLQSVCDSLQGKFDLSKMKLLSDISGPVSGGGAQITKCVLSGPGSYRTAADIVAAYRISTRLANEIVATAGRLNMDPGWLANIMSMESGFDPQVINKYCKKDKEKEGKDPVDYCATGLIQFMPSTAKSIGTTTRALYGMSATKQMYWVERYLARKSAITSQADAYMAVFYPVAMGKPDNYSIADHYAGKTGAAPGSNKYNRRRALIIRQNGGIITKADYANKAIKKSKFDPPC